MVFSKCQNSLWMLWTVQKYFIKLNVAFTSLWSSELKKWSAYEDVYRSVAIAITFFFVSGF